MQIDKNKKIILDADVIIHFIRGNQIGILPQIFSNKYYLLDYVFKEVFKGKLRTEVENLFRFGLVHELEFENNLEVVKEFAKLKKDYGIGESACMAYCKFNKDVLASSNLKDIKTYCTVNNIQYLTTMDFLLEAYEQTILSEADCDEFIYNVKSKGSKLPVNTIQEYILMQSKANTKY